MATNQTTTQKLTSEQYEAVQAMKKAGLMEWQAVVKVLGLTEDTNFVTFAAGSSSRPEDGLWVKFF